MEKEILIFKNELYVVNKFLGKGKGGYSYLVKDNDRNPYVLKKIHHEPCSYYTFGNKIEAELNDYKRLFEIGIRMPKFVDIDIENEIVLKEYIEGKTIYEMLIDGEDVSAYVMQVKEMCRLLYPTKTNIDYFPTNFVVQDKLLYYVDYECNDYSEEWNFENWGIKYWSMTDELKKYIEDHKKK